MSTPAELARDALSKIATHEEVCAVRYVSIDNRLKMLNDFQTRLMWTLIATLTSSVGGLIAMAFSLAHGK